MNAPESAPAPAGADETVIADLGSRSAKSIKRLRRGEGRLLEDVDKLMAQLKADSVIGEKAQPIVVVVKGKGRAFPLPFKF